jgi:hypothetical protein
MPVLSPPVDAPPVTAASGSARIGELDILRGFLLLWMTLTHLPTRVSVYSNQAFGYVSAAEGFIFMAAVLTGQVYRGAAEKYGEATALDRLLRRAGRIYRYHATLLAAAFTIVAWVAIHFRRAPIANLLDYYLAHPKTAVVAALTLVYNPPLLDILPMYIIFTLLTPVLLWAARRYRWRTVLAASGIVWLFAQWKLRAHLYAVLGAHGFPIPAKQAGAFDLFAWQLLWVFGLGLGSSISRDRLSRLRLTPALVAACAAIAVALFLCRHSPLALGVFVDKWRLGLVRLVDFAAIAVLLLRFGQSLARIPGVAALAPLGRASLEVFSVHVLCCLTALGLSAASDPVFPYWEQALILIVSLAVLFQAGYWADRRKSACPRAPRPVTTSAASYSPVERRAYRPRFS